MLIESWWLISINFTSWDSARALTRGTRDAVPSRKLHVGECRYVSILCIIFCLTVSILAASSQRVLTLVFLLGQVWLGLAHSCSCLYMAQEKAWGEKNCWQCRCSRMCWLTTYHTAAWMWNRIPGNYFPGGQTSTGALWKNLLWYSRNNSGDVWSESRLWSLLNVLYFIISLLSPIFIWTFSKT